MINEIVNHVKSRLGMTHRRLELSEEDIVNLLQTETLPTLSVYFPFYLEYMLDTQTTLVEGMGNTYNLPTELMGFRIIGCEKVIDSLGYTASSGMNFGILGTDMVSSMTNFMNTKLSNGLTMAMLPPTTFQFMPPNLLRVHNTYSGRNLFTVLKSTHRKDFSTLPFGLLESVKRLALADVANDLLGIRNYFQNVGTTFGEINLNLDQLKEWSDKRDDLIESFRKNQLKNTGAKKIYVA
jgi:hypothetical protein